jgi:uncharacterized Zn finger protein (UPF0148 family)
MLTTGLPARITASERDCSECESKLIKADGALICPRCYHIVPFRPDFDRAVAVRSLMRQLWGRPAVRISDWPSKEGGAGSGL